MKTQDRVKVLHAHVDTLQKTKKHKQITMALWFVGILWIKPLWDLIN